jgi:predicted DNA-binding transcriptional regulator AlpA
MNQLMSTKDIGSLLQLGRTSVYAITASEGFPAPYALAGRIKRWPIEAVTLWLETQREGREEVVVVPTGMVTSNGFTIHTL